MTGDANAEQDATAKQDRARRFRDAALPYLDDVYALARYLMRNAADAEDAVQECYLRALRHFDSYRGPAMKPWLLAILRNVCNAEFARRGRQDVPTDCAGGETGRRRDADLAGAAGFARSRTAAPAGRRHDPPAGRRAAACRSARPSCCARSTNCRIRRSPRSPACRSAR